jgi:hypothetical protein
MVARDGIEPSTRGFSIQLRARFGARKPKNGNEFSTGRPSRAVSLRNARTSAHHARAGTELRHSIGVWHGASTKPNPNVISRQYRPSSHGQRTRDGLRCAPPSLTIAQSHRDRQPAVLRPGPPDQVPDGRVNGRTPQAGPLRTASVSGSVYAAHQPVALPTRERARCRSLEATRETPECTDMSGGRNDGRHRE